MFNRLSISIFLSLGLLFVLPLRAATTYVAQVSQGSGDGSSAGNAKAVGSFSFSSLSAGDSVHFVGTLTNNVTISTSGSAGNPITLYFEPNARFSAPTFPGNWITVNSGQSYIVIDGGANGIIENTSNGTVVANGGTMAFGNDGAGISADTVTHLTVQNLTIRNLYQRQTNTEPIQNSGDGNDIFISGLSSSIVISNCWLGEALNGISMTYGSTVSSNLTITACTLTNFNHGITLGAGGVTTPLFNNLTITHCTLQGGDMFESGGGMEFGLHRNPIFIFNESSDKGGAVSNIVIAYNFICMGAHPLTSTAGTGGIFFDTYNSDMTKHVRVYNNISTLVKPLTWSGGGGLMSAIGNDVLLANNTVVQWFDSGSGLYGDGAATFAGTNVYSFNNIIISKNGYGTATWQNTSTLGSSSTNGAAVAAALGSIGQSDYNLFNGQSGFSEFVAVIFQINTSSTWYEGIPDSFSQWQAWYGFDKHSLTAPVQLDANFVPLSTDTVAIGNGTNLTALGITDDFNGNPRPATGMWTIGAYQVASTAPFVSLVATPTIINNGQPATLTWSSLNATNLVLNGTGQVALNGSTSVSPTKTTTYVITATGTNGTRSASASVAVRPSPPVQLPPH